MVRASALEGGALIETPARRGRFSGRAAQRKYLWLSRLREEQISLVVVDFDPVAFQLPNRAEAFELECSPHAEPVSYENLRRQSVEVRVPQFRHAFGDALVDGTGFGWIHRGSTAS